MRIRLLLALAAVAPLFTVPATPAHAALAEGAVAPDFTAHAAQGGRRFDINLRQALRRGPVVIYFFPRAFTQGCTIETHAFAEAMPQFRRAGASVIGMSGDDVATLARFSTEACRAAFPMASADAATIAAYDVSLAPGITNRTSYVIGQDGRIVLVHSDMSPADHITLTLAAVQRLQAARHPAPRRRR